jgi:hypothetical protein
VPNVATAVAAWSGFYVMIGSAAAALTGLMFVVITLVREQQAGPSEEGVATFSTPTVVHFCCALFTAALMSAPFRSLTPIALLSGLAGVAGIVYVLRVARRTTRLSWYRPDMEDWTFVVTLPLVAYAILVAGGAGMLTGAQAALYAPAVAVLLLIFIGIHNAWDVVTYIAIGKRAPSAEQREPAMHDPD